MCLKTFQRKKATGLLLGSNHTQLFEFEVDHE